MFYFVSKDGLELLFNVFERLQESGVTMLLPAYCVWVSYRLDVAIFCTPLFRFVGAVVVLARRHKFFLLDKNFLSQVFVKLDLLRAQLLDFTVMNLSLFEVLVLEIELSNLPLFDQVHAIFLSLIQFLLLLVELLLALCRQTLSAR